MTELAELLVNDALTSRWYKFVEEFVEPNIWNIFPEKGIDIQMTSLGIWTEHQGVKIGFDLFAVNYDDNKLVLVECETRLSKDDVDEFVDKLHRFKISFPHYQNYQVYGAVAGIEINEGIDRYAYRQGLFVIKPSGDGVAIANDETFRPLAY